MGTDIYLQAQIKRGEHWETATLPEEATGWRNYAVFAVLADIRNYEDLPVIAPPRGLPADLRAQGVVDPANQDACFHSTSWLSLEELQRYDWEGPAWQSLLPTLGGPVPRHWQTRHFREVVLPALARLGPPQEVRIVFSFDC